MPIETRIEHELKPETHAEIAALRSASFPECQHARSYLKQLPHFRLLACEEVDGPLVGHLGMDHRMMRFGEEVAKVFGIIDLCVAEKYRGRGIGGSLLAEAERVACEAGIDALFLFALDRRLYERHGFEMLDAECTWMRIDEHLSLGMTTENIVGEIMIKRLNAELNLDGPIDLLGYLY